jgi:hypothetical protein
MPVRFRLTQRLARFHNHPSIQIVADGYDRQKSARASSHWRHPRRRKDVPFIPSDPLNGIIAHLTRACGENVHSRGIVSVTASGKHMNHIPAIAADLESNSYFQTTNAPNSWLCYDFKNVALRPTHYAVRSYFGGGPGTNHPKSWVVEGSRDGKGWTELDWRDDNDDNTTQTFALARSDEVRLIRFRQTGPNYAGYHYLGFSSLKIFGCLLG